MRFLFVWLLAFQLASFSLALDYGVSPLGEAARVERDILDGKLASRTEQALDTVIRIACEELRRRGHAYEASRFETEWYETYKYDFRSFTYSMRPIGEPHKPLSQWLADKYNMLEMLLGVDVMKRTHLSDIKTFNFTIPIVFRPCSFDMAGLPKNRIEEYRDNFSYDDVYYGLVPVVTYWAIYAGVTVGTSGTGFAFLAGIAASIGEKAISLITPSLSDKVFTKICG